MVWQIFSDFYVSLGQKFKNRMTWYFEFQLGQKWGWFDVGMNADWVGDTICPNSKFLPQNCFL